MAFPFIELGAGLLGGLLGGGPSIPPEQRQLFRLQRNAARDLQDYSRSVPGSSADELAALASQRGLLGQQQRATIGGLFGSLGASGSPAPFDLLGNLATQFQGQQSALTGQHILNSLAARRNALLQSAQIAAGALPAAQPTQQGTDLGGILGGLGQAYAYHQGLKGLQPRQPGTVNVGRAWQPGGTGGPGSAGPRPDAAMLLRRGPFGIF